MSSEEKRGASFQSHDSDSSDDSAFVDAADFDQAANNELRDFVRANDDVVRANDRPSTEVPSQGDTLFRRDRSRLSAAGRASLSLSHDAKIADYPSQIGNDFQPSGGVRDVMRARASNRNANPFEAPSPHDITPDMEMHGNPAATLRRYRGRKGRKPEKGLPPAPSARPDLSLPLDRVNRPSSEGKTSDRGSSGGSSWRNYSQGRPRLHSNDAGQPAQRSSRKRPSPSTNSRNDALVDETTVKKLAKLHMQKRSAQRSDSAQMAKEGSASAASLEEDSLAPFPSFNTESGMTGVDSSGGSMFSAARRRKRRQGRGLGGFGMTLSISNSNTKTPPASPRDVGQETAAFETAAAAAAAAANSASGGGGAAQSSQGAKVSSTKSNDNAYSIDAQGSLHVQGFELNESGIRRAPEKEGILQPFFLKTRLLRLDMLGRGASGSVYKAIHLPTLRVVAVKVIPVFDAAKRKQMIQELKVLYKNLVPLDKRRANTNARGSSDSPPRGAQRMGCPFMVGFYDAFITPNDGTVSIVMEYMDGGSLQDIVDNGGCQSEQALANISARVLHGLSFIHENHQIHRDIKPSNLLINHFGEVKISDFGTVRELDNTNAKAKTFVGTLSYMSPERMRAENYTNKSDIWSFGVSLLSCAQGKFPFPVGASYWELLEYVSKGELNLPAHFSAEFRDFLRLALKKKGADRPTARQMLRHPWLRAQSLAALVADQEEAAAVGSNDGSDTARNDLAEICDIVMGKYLEYATLKLQQRLPLAQALISPLDSSRLRSLSKQLGLSPQIVHMKFENKRLELNADLRRRYSELTSFGAGELDSSSEGEISSDEGF